MSDKIRVGIIGANPEKGWGAAVHIPALQGLSAYELVAVGTSRQESADESARRFGARLAFADPTALSTHPDVDLVVVCVKAPDHHRLAKIALEAGKHVFCEWPLAANTAQAEELVALAAAKHVRTMVGLQARAAPEIRRARELIAEGHIGRLLSANMVCSLPGGGGKRSREGLYVIDRRNGASTMAIHGGHAIDALGYLVGPFASLSGVVSTQFTETTIIETGETVEKTSPDQVLISGTLANGAVASVHINGGVVSGLGCAITLHGTDGTLRIETDSRYNFQMAPLTLLGARAPETKLAPLPIPESNKSAALATSAPSHAYPGVKIPPATRAKVATLYREFATAIRTGQDVEPTFATGLAMHRLLDAIDRSSETGVRVTL